GEAVVAQRRRRGAGRREPARDHRSPPRRRRDPAADHHAHPARGLARRARPGGAVPMSLDGALPARLDPDGKLRVQVRPGSHLLVLEARLPGPVDALALSAPSGPWDDREEWVFEARPSLRIVSLEGAPSIDPQQTELPAEWRALPAYAMEPGASLRFATKRRGDADPAPDRLSLVRTWWLDFDGGGAPRTGRR